MLVGIVGCGRMGRERALACAMLGHEVTLVYDNSSARANDLAAMFPRSRAASEFIGSHWKSLDAMFICTPPGAHMEFLQFAIEAHLPFLMEKPIDVSGENGKPVLRSLALHPIVNAVGYMNRCRSSVQHARMILKNCQTLGITCHWAGKKYTVPWWLDRSLSGGAFNEQATHLVDLCRFLVGEIEAVTSISGRKPEQTSDSTIAVALAFTGGEVGTIFYSCEARDKQIGIHILAVEGSLELSGWEFSLKSNSINGTIPVDDELPIYVAETGRFLRAVGENNPALVACDYAEAFRTQLVVDATRYSLEMESSTRITNGKYKIG